jgi:hypothetical protein
VRTWSRKYRLRNLGVLGSTLRPRISDLHGEEGEARAVTGLELDEHVHVALGREVVPQDRPEEGETPDMVTPAEVGDRLSIERDLHGHVFDSITRPRRRTLSIPQRPPLGSESTSG